MGSIYSHKSFEGLDEVAQQEIHRHFSKVLKGDLPEWNTLDLFRHRNYLTSNLQFIGKRVKEINPATFQFLNKLQREALLNELLFSFYMISAQYHLDDIESRKQNSAKQLAELQLCAAKIMALRAYDHKGPEVIHQQLLDESSQPVKFLGLTIVAPFLIEKVEQISGGKATKSFREWWDEFNGQRAYLSRANAVLLGVLRLLPDDFTNKIHGQTVLGTPAPVFGYLSWILYYIRFGVNLGLLLKHTIEGPWMKKEESDIPWHERFTTQWEQRRFTLLNDFIWATINMASFFWLLGTPELSYTANVLTIVFMTIDVGLVLWRYMAESTEHNKNAEKYAEDIATLKVKIAELKDGDPRKAWLDEELRALLKAKQHFDLEWKYKTYGIANDLFYVVGLLASFAVTSAFLAPPALMPTNILMFSLVGAVVCFAVTLAYSAITGLLAISKTKELAEMNASELVALKEKFNTCEDETVKRLLYLDIQALNAKSEYHQQLIAFQKIQLIRSVLVNSLLPVLAFSCFVFMPLGIGLAVFAVGFALAKYSESKLQEYAPKEAEALEFDEPAYQQFIEEQKNEKAIEVAATNSNSNRFFKPEPQTPAIDISLDSAKKLTG